MERVRCCCRAPRSHRRFGSPRRDAPIDARKGCHPRRPLSAVRLRRRLRRVVQPASQRSHAIGPFLTDDCPCSPSESYELVPARTWVIARWFTPGDISSSRPMRNLLRHGARCDERGCERGLIHVCGKTGRLAGPSHGPNIESKLNHVPARSNLSPTGLAVSLC